MKGVWADATYCKSERLQQDGSWRAMLGICGGFITAPQEWGEPLRISMRGMKWWHLALNEIESVIYGECVCWWLWGVGRSGMWGWDSSWEATAETQAKNMRITNVFLKSAKKPIHKDLWFQCVNRRNLFSLSFFFNDYYLMWVITLPGTVH